MNCQECHDYIDPYVDNELDVAATILQNGYNVLHWERDGFAFWAVSDVSAGDLTAFADLAMTHLIL